MAHNANDQANSIPNTPSKIGSANSQQTPQSALLERIILREKEGQKARRGRESKWPEKTGGKWRESSR
jgi:23S rRNA maturation mini-RNase III